jgi:hypothetical protein
MNTHRNTICRIGILLAAAISLIHSNLSAQNNPEKEETVRYWVSKIMSDAKEQGMHINFLQVSDLKYQNGLYQSYSLEPNKEYTFFAIAEDGIAKIAVRRIENDESTLFAEEESDLLLKTFTSDRKSKGIFSVSCYLKDIINPGKYIDMYGKTIIIALCSKQ